MVASQFADFVAARFNLAVFMASTGKIGILPPRTETLPRKDPPTLIQAYFLRVNLQTSLSMLLPATIQRAPSWTKTLAAWRGRQGVLGTSCQVTPSAECQTSLRLAL